MMHIAFITPEYPHSKVNRVAGIGTSIRNLIQGMRDHCKDPMQFSLFIYGQQEDLYFEENGICFHLIKKRSYRFGGFFWYRKHINRYVNKVVKKDNIQCIEAPDWTGITAFMSFKIPLLIRLHGTDTYFCDLEGRAVKRKNYFFERNALKRTNTIVSVSAFTASRTKALFGLKKPIDVIHNSIDLNNFTPLRDIKTAHSILYFGSIIRKKGVLALAKAFNHVTEQDKSTTLILLGQDVIDNKTGKSTLSLFRNLLTPEAKKRITHISHVPYAKVKKHIQQAAVVCLPSYAEAFPMTWLEAMAMEKAMVTSDIGWAKEVMIHEKTGLMVNPDEESVLAEALMTLLKEREQATHYGKAARKKLLTNFAPGHIARQNHNVYQKLIDS